MTTRTPGALTGRRVAVTRAADQSADLVALLRARGAAPLVCPTIAVAPPASYEALDAALRALERYHWAAFTSANAVTAFADRLAAVGVGVPSALRLAAVGMGTARVLAARIRAADFVPRTASGEVLGEELDDVDGRRILCPRGDLAGDAVVRTLRARGATVDDVVAYRTIPGEGAGELARLVRTGGVHAILFMSASSVRHFLDALASQGGAAALGRPGPAVVCIGPETARAARDAGIDVSEVATERTAAGLVEAVERWFTRLGDVGGR